MSAVQYIFDVPVYRLPEEKYYSERRKYIDEQIFPPNDPDTETRRQREQNNPGTYVAWHDHLERAFGGCWQFNEIIGYIRLHFLGSQIRGEYFGVKRKRIVRTRTKTLEYQTHKLAPEIQLPASATSEEIFRLMMEYLSDCRKELKGRHIDSELL